MVFFYIFRGIRDTSFCADELWLYICSEVSGALLSVLMSYGYLYIQGIRSTSLCADELWLFICSEVLGSLLSDLMSYGYLYIQRY